MEEELERSVSKTIPGSESVRPNALSEQCLVDTVYFLLFNCESKPSLN